MPAEYPIRSVVAGPANPKGRRRYGVAPEADLLVGKVLSDGGFGYDDQIIDGISWAYDQGAAIISMSLGSARNSGADYSTVYEAIAEVLLDDSPGALVIAAAGNESNWPHYVAAVGNPAACPSVMGVAAVDRDRKVAYFSCRQLDPIGDIDVSGPGVAVYSSWTGGGYQTISGTSMATPHVAGVAALHRQAHPTLTARQLWDRLKSTAIALGRPEDFGHGLVQVPS